MERRRTGYAARTGRLLFTAALAVLSPGCTAALERPSAALGAQGVQVATALRLQTTALADALERSNGVDLLLQTRLRLATCARLGDCPSGAAWRSVAQGDPSSEADATIAHRITALSAAVRRRAAALNALAAAYASFEDEASGAKTSHLAQAVGAAAQAASGYASALAAVDGGEGAGPTIAPAVAPIATAVTRLLEARSRETRLAAASATLQGVVVRLSAALTREQEAFQAVAAYVAGKEAALEDALLDDGVISPAAALADAGLVSPGALAQGADAAIGAHPAMGGAIRQVLQDRRDRAAGAQARSYAAAREALAALGQAHDALAAHSPDATGQLEAAVDALQSASGVLETKTGRP